MLRPLLCVALAVPLAAQGWVDHTGPTWPSPRQHHAMCYDAAHGYVMMAGGWPQIFFGSLLEVWTWNGTSWTRRATASTPNGQGYQSVTMAFHAATNEVVMVLDLATYTWDGSDWSPRGSVAPGSATNGGSVGSPTAAAFDPVHNQTVLFLTQRYNSTPFLAETYVWDGFGWSLRNTPVHPVGDAVGMTFDPVANRLLLCTSINGGAWFWEWTGSNWQQRLYSTAPANPGALTTDTAHGKVVMLDSVMTSAPNHTWTFANGQGTQLSTPIEPTRRLNGAMAYDAARGSCVLFGGTTGGPVGSGELGDTWEFTLGVGAAYSVFGAGCAGSRGVPWIAAQGTSLPHVGRTFELHVGNLPFTGPVFVFLGLSNTSYGPTPLPFNLGGFGAPACSVLCSGDEVRLVTNVLGSAVWTIDVPPNFPGVTFYNQAFAIDPAANALGITASNGGQGTTGF
ncbi:MAG TPA: hypothetical protein VK348_13250 [Planctomycetota bacterium]|nr:hypothetical protein [Planctomycetota bacterium]